MEPVTEIHVSVCPFIYSWIELLHKLTYIKYELRAFGGHPVLVIYMPVFSTTNNSFHEFYGIRTIF